MKHKKIQKQAVEQLVRRANELALPKKSRLRLQWILFYVQHDYNASLTCRHFGIARNTFALWLNRFDANDEQSLEERSRRPKKVRQPETDPMIVTMVEELRRKNPLMNKDEICTQLEEKGQNVSPATVGRIITKNRFFYADTPSHRRKRMSAEEHSSSFA